MLSWLVIGGGIHGTCVARALHAAGHEARILEPTGELLSRWEQRAQAVGMTRLRSPVSHHLEDHDTHMHSFAEVEARGTLKDAPFHGPFKRPSLELFRRHCAAVIERHGLRAWVWTGRAMGLTRVAGGVRVHTDGGSIDARRVVLATGQTEAHEPGWAAALREAGRPVAHVLAEGFEPPLRAAGERWAVIGGGISAVQVALRLLAIGAAAVTLVADRAPLCTELDSDLRWAREGSLRLWAQLDPSARASLLQRARYRGSVPPALWERAERERRRGRLRLLLGEPSGVASSTGVRVQVGSTTIDVDRVVLATGLCPPLSSQRWLVELATSLELPIGPGSAPVVGPSLAWGHGIFVTGRLAEQALGPVAPNLLGARWAARRIVRAG